MNKRIIAVLAALIAALLCSFSTVAFAEEYEDYHLGRLEDYLNALTDDEEYELEQLIQNAAEEVGINIAVILADDLNGRSSQAYTDSYLDYTFGEYSDSIVFMLPKSGSGDFEWISYTNKAYDLYRRREDAIFDAFNSGLDRGGENYPEAIREFCAYLTAHKTPGIHFSLNGISLIGLAIGLIVAICVVNGTAKKYSKKAPISARRYINESMSRFTERSDVFVREYTTSHKVSSSSSGGRSGGGSRRGGGGGRRR